MAQEYDLISCPIESMFVSPQSLTKPTQILEDEEEEMCQVKLDITGDLNSEVFQNILDRILLSGQQPNDQEIQQLNDVQIKILEAICEKKYVSKDLPKKQKRVEEK
jgi:hypothetical protein